MTGDSKVVAAFSTVHEIMLIYSRTIFDRIHLTKSEVSPTWAAGVTIPALLKTTWDDPPEIWILQYLFS